MLRITLTAVEVTSPDTIVLAPDFPIPQPDLLCEGPPVDATRGVKFDLSIDVNTETGCPIYRDPRDRGVNSQVLVRDNANVTLSKVMCFGVKPTGHNIEDLARIELVDLAIHETGYYQLHIYFEAVYCKKKREIAETLAKLVTREIRVYK